MLLVSLALVSLGHGQSKIVPKARIAALSRGIRVDADTVQSDLDQIRELGFTNVETSDPKIAASALASELSVTVDAEMIPQLKILNWDSVFVLARSNDEYVHVRGLFPAATIVVDSELAPFTNLANAVVKRRFAISDIFLSQGLKGSEDLRSVPYPSNPADITQALAEADDRHKDAIYQYGKERWNRDRIKRTLESVINPFQRVNVPIIVVGLVVSAKAPSESRSHYVSDLASVLKELRCGWQAESYLEPMGPFKGSAGSRKIDEAWLSSLGLAGR